MAQACASTKNTGEEAGGRQVDHSYIVMKHRTLHLNITANELRAWRSRVTL